MLAAVCSPIFPKMNLCKWNGEGENPLSAFSDFFSFLGESGNGNESIIWDIVNAVVNFGGGQKD